MFFKGFKRKMIPYKIAFGITTTIITWLLYSISEVDFNFFLAHYGLYSILILTASFISLIFLVFNLLNKVIKILKEYELNQDIGYHNL